MSNKVAISDVTQLVQLDETATLEPRAKRRRISSEDREISSGGGGFSIDSCLEKLLAPVEGDNYQVKIPWLQIMTTLLTRYPDTVEDGRVNSITKCLAGLIQSTKTVATRRHILAACRSLLVGRSEIEFTENWEVILRNCTNMVSMNQAGPEGHSLLRVLFKIDGARIPTSQLYSMYTNKLLIPSPESILTLNELLRVYSIQDELNGFEKRKSILAWLFPDLQDGEGENKKIDKGPPVTIAKVLAVLGVQTFPQKEACVDNETVVDNENAVLEKRLLVASLGEVLQNNKKAVTTDADSSESNPTIIRQVQQNAQDLLVQESAQCLTEVSNRPDDVMAAVKQAHVVILYMEELLRLGYQMEEMSRLTNLYQTIIKRVESCLVRITSKDTERCNKLVEIFQDWNKLLLCTQNLQSELRMFVADSAPLELLDKIEWLIAEECKQIEKDKDQTIRPNGDTNGATQHNPFDDFNTGADPFDDFETVGVETDNTVEKIDFDMEKEAENMEEVLKRLDCIRETSRLSVIYSAPSIILPNMPRELSGRQVTIVEILESVLRTYDYNIPSFKVFCDVSKHLVTSGNITREAVSAMIVECIESVRKFLGKDIFNQDGLFYLLDLVTILIPAVHQKGSDLDKADLLKILAGLVKFNTRDEYNRLSPKMVTNLVKALGLAASTDPSCSWTTWPSAVNNITCARNTPLDIDSDEDVGLELCLPRYLMHSSQNVRLSAAVSIADHQAAKGGRISERMFSLVVCAIGESLQDDVADHVKVDALAARVGSGLSSLVALAVVSPSDTRRVVTAALKIYRSQRINKSALANFVGLVSRSRGIELEFGLLRSILSGILDDYFRDGGNIQTFPIFLLGCEDVAQFVCSFESSVVPLALLHSPKAETLSHFCTYTGKSPEKLLKDNFKNFSLLILPGIAERELHQPKNSQSEELADFLERQLGSNDFHAYIEKYAESTLLLTFLHVKDDKALKEAFQLKSFCGDQDDPPHYTAGTPKLVIQYLGSLYEDSTSSIWVLLNREKPSAIPTSAVQLTAPLRRQKHYNNSKPLLLQSLFRLSVWLESLFAGDTHDDLKQVTPFLSWFLTHSLLNFWMDHRDDTELVIATLVVVKKLVASLLPLDPVSVGKCLMSINSSLVTIADTGDTSSTVRKAAIDVLNFLVIENGFRLAEAIAQLDTYPSKNCFSLLQSAASKHQSRRDDSLLGNLARFQKMSRSADPISLARSLTSLETRIKSSSKSLALLLDRKREAIRELVSDLVKLTSSSNDTVSIAAARCLGELGPVDLNSEILDRKKTVSGIHEHAMKPSRKYITVIALELVGLLVSNDSQVSTQAQKTLKSILSSCEEASKLSEADLGDHYGVCLPFLKGNKAKSSNFQIDEDKFKATVDLVDLWLPVGGGLSGHYEWVTRLVVSLLECVGKACVLGYLTNICRIQPLLCETVLPFIIHELLLLDKTGDIRLILTTKINLFFEQHFTHHEETRSRAATPMPGRQTPDSTTSATAPASLITMLQVISYLREQPLAPQFARRPQITAWDNNFWLDVDYLHIARAALR